MDKTKLSVAYLFEKVACLFFVVQCLLFISKGEYVHLIFLPVYLFATRYFFKLPTIKYDNYNLYIKRLTKPEISIPLSKITCLAHSRYEGGNHGAYKLTIEYIDEATITCQVKCYAKPRTEKMATFIALVLKQNHGVRIS